VAMSEAAVLRDLLDTLKHASACYLRAAHEAADNDLRRTFEGIAVDKSEQKNAVFNLMRQAGHYETKPAAEDHMLELKRQCDDFLARIGTDRPVERELRRN